MITAWETIDGKKIRKTKIIGTYSCAFSECKKVFERYSKYVRNPWRVYCSPACRSAHQKETQKGTNNSNYKNGLSIDDKKCSCGRLRDQRSEKCSICAHKSFSRTGEDRFTETVLQKVVLEANSLLGASKKLGVSRNTIKSGIKQHDISTEHFVPGRGRPKNLEEVFVKRTGHKRSYSLRTIVLREKVLEYCCAKCGLGPEWEGEKLSLELDHINGDRTDDRLENLRFLCPNCHSQTPTHRGHQGLGNKKPRRSKNEDTVEG